VSQHSLKKRSEDSYKINISPSKFEMESPVKLLHDNWFVNLSKITIPEEVKLVLQLGEKFGIPFVKGDMDKMIDNFIKCIENNIFKQPETTGIYNKQRN